MTLKIHYNDVQSVCADCMFMFSCYCWWCIGIRI